jgi:prefoldin subunit 5
MKQFINRNLTTIVATMALMLVVSLGVGAYLVAHTSSLDSRLAAARAREDQLQTDLERVEGGAAIYAAQLTAFQEELSSLGPTIDTALGDAVTSIDAFRNSTIRFDVAIDEVIPIDAEVVLDRTLDVPINTVLPIDETFDTTITVNGPFGIDIPLDITVPIKLDLPIDLEVAIPVNETIPVNTEVPVNLDVPIAIDISKTELAALADALQQGLESFRRLAARLGQ